MMFYIRADANSMIGSGHVMRCLSIAHALLSRGVDTTFITADRNSEELISRNGFSIICLDSDWNDLEEELQKLEEIILINRIDQMLIDSYYVTERYLEHLGKMIKIVYIDDINKFIYPVDILINYNIYADRLINKEEYDHNRVKLLLGCEYTPLREEFRGKRTIIKEKVSNILITTGGADTYNAAGNLLQFLYSTDQYSEINFHVVIGCFHQHKEKLEILAANFHNIILHYQVTEMSKLMVECDIAISAGGSTLYELCACAIPTISFSYADNQLDSVREFHKREIIYYAGDIRADKDTCINHIVQRLHQLMTSAALRKNVSVRMSALVDGLGTTRIINEIIV